MVAETNVIRRNVRHLTQLQQQLARQNVTANMDSRSELRVTLQVPGVDGAITCRSNPKDANHPWYWHHGEPLTPAADTEQAREAAKTVLALRTEATFQ